MYFTRKVWTRRKVKPPLPPINKWRIRLVLPGMSSEMLPIRASLRTFTAKKKRTPNLERRPSIMHYPIGAASRVDSSYQYPWLAACLRCYLAGRSIVVVVKLFAAFKVQLDQVFCHSAEKNGGSWFSPSIKGLLRLHSFYANGIDFISDRRSRDLFPVYKSDLTLSLFASVHLTPFLIGD